MSAQFVDALIGYGYYLKSRGKSTLIEINDYLIGLRRSPIQQRTYTHYKKLITNGFRSYIPINKFDVFQSLGKIQMAADRRRYNRESVDLRVQVSRNNRNWIDGKIVDRSLVGFGIVTDRRFPVRTGAQIMVRINGYDDIPTILVWRKHQDGFTKMGVRALEFIAKYRISEKEIESARLSGVFIINREIENDLSWDNIFRVLSKADEFLKAIGDLIYSLSELIGYDVRLASPMLSSIKFGSPGEVQIKIDFGIAELAKTIIDKIQFWGLDKRKYQAEIKKLELENTKLNLEADKMALENINYKIEIFRNAINLRNDAQQSDFIESCIKEIEEPLRKILGIKQLPEGIFEPESPEHGILSKRIIPAATELVAGDDPDFDIKVTTERPDIE